MGASTLEGIARARRRDRRGNSECKRPEAGRAAGPVRGRGKAGCLGCREQRRWPFRMQWGRRGSVLQVLLGRDHSQSISMPAGHRVLRVSDALSLCVECGCRNSLGAP